MRIDRLSGMFCRTFIPSVVEPSFGIGRIMYCMFEHCYYTRGQDKQRTVFSFTPIVAPVKATVFPLMQKPELVRVAREVSASLTRAGISNIIDTTGEGLTEAGLVWSWGRSCPAGFEQAVKN